MFRENLEVYSCYHCAVTLSAVIGEVSLTPDHDNNTWAVVESSLIVIGVAVGRWAASVDSFNVGGTDDRAVTALGGLDRRRWAAHEHARLVDLGFTQAPWRGEVPLLAWGQTGHHLEF